MAVEELLTGGVSVFNTGINELKIEKNYFSDVQNQYRDKRVENRKKFFLRRAKAEKQFSMQG